jgi:hypothetical protein
MLKLEIAESAETLKQLMHQNCHPQQKAKLQALWWLQSGQASSVNRPYPGANDKLGAALRQYPDDESIFAASLSGVCRLLHHHASR